VPALVRHGLGVESGLNDGIALPVLTLLLATAVVEAGEESSISALETFLRGLVYSSAVGAAAGAAGGWLLVHAARRGWVAKYWRRATALAVALLAWALAVWLDGSGFIGAWAGGLVFGVFARKHVPKACDLVEELSSILITLSFLLFGALLLGPALHRLTWQIALYAVVSLTIVRLVPVALSLIGSGLRRQSVLYMGWFGPRGLASIVFVGLVVEEALPATSAISTAVMFTVGLSVLLHGVSATLGAHAYASWYKRALETGVPLAESADVRVVTGARRLDMGTHDDPSSPAG
jgi:NhaP-type Na+/H+ or K+/H+ antiporter